MNTGSCLHSLDNNQTSNIKNNKTSTTRQYYLRPNHCTSATKNLLQIWLLKDEISLIKFARLISQQFKLSLAQFDGAREVYKMDKALA